MAKKDLLKSFLDKVKMLMTIKLSKKETTI